MLLPMRSGLEHIEVGDPIERSDTNQVLFVGGTRDMAARAIAKPLAAAPGGTFTYSSLTTITCRPSAPLPSSSSAPIRAQSSAVM